ncbi:MAG: carboxylesterase/lipase family protein [Terriglobia bacterium]
MFARRAWRIVLWAAAVPVLLSPARAATLTVKTDKGEVHGLTSANGRVREFLGIPYAAPPVGNLRWAPPRAAAKWRGVKEATSFGSRCMQPHIYADMRFRDPGESEDCLTLNVWTPMAAKNLPVMVWIYGGGYNTGGTSEPRQDGEHLAATEGVLVVSMNYRLGIFGFFALKPLADESPHHAAGDYGLMDQTAALAWVKKNIANFGGDPSNVTIFGESAGSFSVSAQMASPTAQGLFLRGIGESGSALGGATGSFSTLESAEESAARFAQAVLGTTDLTTLREMSAEKILTASMQKVNGRRVRFWPDMDGYFFPESVPEIYAQGKQAHVPLLAGWNHDEGSIVLQQPAMDSLRALAEKEFGADAPEFLKVYRAADDQQASRVADDFAGDRFIAYSTWAWLEAQVKTGDAPVYRYKFDLGSPGDPNHPAKMGAFHSDDIEYVFGTLNSRLGAKWRPEDYKLSLLMQTYWTNFAKTGNPNGDGLPTWPRYDAADGWRVMHLSPTPGARPDVHRDRYLFLQKEWPKRADQ